MLLPTGALVSDWELERVILGEEIILSDATTSRLSEGSRVRLKRDIENFPSGIFPAGLTGVLVKVGENGDYWVRLDQHFPNLDAWDNQLQLWDLSDKDSSDEHPSTYLEVIAEG